MMSSSASASATVAVDKATSDLLLGPDWTTNMEICDSINSNHWQAKDVVKAVKRRLQHKSPRVQLLALTLLETLVNNCGEYLHFQIAEKNILGEMVKIVKKKVDMQVRDKILGLLDSWQEAFGGPGGKYPQYYWAYEELRRSGVEFPRRSLNAAPVITPPASHHPAMRQPQAVYGISHVGYGMPSGSSRRLDEAMATEVESLSLSSLESMRDLMDLVSDMLEAVDPNDREAVKDEVIVDLVERCRSNQKKLMQMLTTTGDEELLARGLELNDCLQTILAKHDAIASGSPLPIPAIKPAVSSPRSSDTKESSSGPGFSSPVPATVSVGRSPIDEEDEQEDEFAQLARRHSRPIGNNGSEAVKQSNGEGGACNALALPDPPAPVNTSTTKEQAMIDLLSITLTTPSTPLSPQPAPTAPTAPVYPPPSQQYPPSNTYVAPWARPQPQPQPQPLPLPSSQPQPYAPFQTQQPSRPQPSYGYPPPPWAATQQNMYWSPQANSATSAQAEPEKLNNGVGEGWGASSGSNAGSSVGQKPAFVPSYRLFEDLNVFGKADDRTGSKPGNGMLGGRK